MAVCQNLVPLVNIKIAGKWMFIPLKMVLIGIDPYPYNNICSKTVHLETAPGAPSRVAFFLNCASTSGGRASCSNFGDERDVTNMAGTSCGKTW
jgi:hypothetical protein